MVRVVMRFCLAVVVVVVLGFHPESLHAEVTPVAGWGHQIFPSYVIATATMRQNGDAENEEGDEETPVLGDRNGLLGVEVESPADAATVTVTITSDSILEPSTFTATLDEEGTTYRIFPTIKYKYGTLMKNKQSVPVSVTFRVEVADEVADEEAEEATATLTLRSINDCPFTVVDEDDETRDVSFVFAAYVNEQHPFVDKVLREALDAGVVDSFTGYQGGNPASVYRQAYALWHALSQRDVRYSNITASAAENLKVGSQHVRLIDESINNAQANCVDGSVLLASLLRKIDIEPILVFVPGHCYLAFCLDPQGKELVGLETTLIGSQIEGEPKEVGKLKGLMNDEWRQENSWATFCAAVGMGCANLTKNMEKFNKADDAHYQTVSIAAARKRGILPIAFDSAAQFQALSKGEE